MYPYPKGVIQVADIGAIIETWLKNNGWTHKMLTERLQAMFEKYGK